MKDLSFRFEWVPAPGVRAPELRATWARLEIWVGDDCVTLVEDHESLATRRSIYVPLYPLAEWIAENWWLLRADARPALSWRNRPASQRHSTRAAGDGFAWPDLAILPEGGVTQLAWRRDAVVSDANPVRFIGQGEAAADPESTRRQLSTLVEAVLTQLSEQGVGGTRLAIEWEHLRQTDEDEAEFCLAAARLGLDPYAEAAGYEEEIIRAAGQLKGRVLDDFFDAVNPRGLGAGLDWVTAAREVVEAEPAQLNDTIGRLRTLVRGAPPGQVGQTPWKHGYRHAIRVREELDIPADRAFELAGLVRARAQPSADRGLQAVGGARDGSTPVLVLGHRPSEESGRFIQARGLWRALSQEDPLFLVTSAHTDRQRIERAFAAELLAPADGLAEWLGGLTEATNEDLEEPAQHFRVSPLVIRHQAENQLGLAVVA